MAVVGFYGYAEGAADGCANEFEEGAGGGNEEEGEGGGDCCVG